MSKTEKVKEFVEKNWETIAWGALGTTVMIAGTILGRKVYKSGFQDGMNFGGAYMLQWMDSTFKDDHIKEKVGKYLIEHAVK